MKAADPAVGAPSRPRLFWPRPCRGTWCAVASSRLSCCFCSFVLSLRGSVGPFFFPFLKNRVVALRTLTVLYNPPSSVSLRTFSSPQKKPSCRIPLTRDIRDRTRGRNGGCQRLSREREVGVHRSMGTKLPLRKVSELWRQSTVVPRGCRHRAAHLQACEEGRSHAKCAYHKKKNTLYPLNRPAPPPSLLPLAPMNSPILDISYNGAERWAAFRVWLLSLSVVFLRFIQHCGMGEFFIPFHG